MSGLDYRSGLITEYFSQYGFTPDPGVIASLVTAIGSPGQEGVAAGEVGTYVNAINALNQAAAADPMQAILASETAALSGDTEAAGQLSQQLQDVYQQAPKLFGSLTPDQIDQYLAPAQNAFTTATEQIQGQEAKTGNTGSSVEASALAQTDQQFKQGVVATGLQIGQQQQQNQAAILQSLLANKTGQANLLYGAQQQTGGAISQQNYANAQFKAQLPILLNSLATQQNQLINNQPSSNWEAALGSGLGTLVGGYFGGPMGAAAGAQLGGGISNDITGNSSTSGVGASGQTGLPSLALLSLLQGGNKGWQGYNWGGSNTTGGQYPYSTGLASAGEVGAYQSAGSTLMPGPLGYNQPMLQGGGNLNNVSLNWASQPG